MFEDISGKHSSCYGNGILNRIIIENIPVIDVKKKKCYGNISSRLSRDRLKSSEFVLSADLAIIRYLYLYLNMNYRIFIIMNVKSRSSVLIRLNI